MPEKLSLKENDLSFRYQRVEDWEGFPHKKDGGAFHIF